MGKKSIEELLNVQTELFENLQETNRHQLERVQSEAALASKFATKLTTTRYTMRYNGSCRRGGARFSWRIVGRNEKKGTR
jgi:hypothetical protein